MVGHAAFRRQGQLRARYAAAVGQAWSASKMGDVVIQRDIPWMVDLYTKDG